MKILNGKNQLLHLNIKKAETHGICWPEIYSSYLGDIKSPQFNQSRSQILQRKWYFSEECKICVKDRKQSLTV
jgi:hypothetical protein